MSFDSFIEKIGKARKINKDDSDFLKKVFDFSKKFHENQLRKSGEPYFNHCIRTALNLAELKLDLITICSGLLHDVLEDTDATEKELSKEFGEEICFLTNGSSKIGKIKYREKNIENAENLKKLILVFSKDIRVALIKLADRLDNMRTLRYLPKEKQKRISLETMDIYAPLAVRLGVSELAHQLEDLAFEYLYPKEYKSLVDDLKEKYNEIEKYLNKVKPVLENILIKNKIKTHSLEYRVKTYYSVFRKLSKYNSDLNQIYDLIAFRITTYKVEDCYLILGLIHSLWLPLREKFKDYIALPKPNGYKSIHATVSCLDGKFVEFQIRTLEMRENNEFGIAAYFAYSEKKETRNYVKRKSAFVKKEELKWLKQLSEWQKEKNKFSEFENSDEYLSALKIEFFEERIFVITPKGKVVELLKGSTPIDFAYKIHSDIGDHCVMAKVNDKIVSLNSELNSGDVVEIITDKNKKPSMDWLDFVRTPDAKRKIKIYLKERNQSHT